MKEDIFDRIMAWRIMKPFRPLYKKYKQPLLYLFFGFLTTAVNLATFWFLISVAHINALIANVIAWIVGVIFAYITNRIWVFRSSDPAVAKEAVSFMAGRLFTLGAEELILWLGIDLLRVNTMLIKVIAQIIVIVGNYVISKWFVFRQKGEGVK